MGVDSDQPTRTRNFDEETNAILVARSKRRTAKAKLERDEADRRSGRTHFNPSLVKYLRPEDRAAWAVRNDPHKWAQQFQLAEKAPHWQDLLPEAIATSYMSEPEGMPELLSLAILTEDRGRAAQRRYGDRLDPYYRTATGAVDEDKLAQDQFIVDLEQAFYGAGGAVPLQFFLDHIADIALLGPKYSQTVRELYAYDSFMQANAETESLIEADFNRRVEGAMEYSNIGRAQAEIEFHNFSSVIDQVNEDSATWSTATKLKWMNDQAPSGVAANIANFFGKQPGLDANDPEFEQVFAETRMAWLASEGGYEGIEQINFAFRTTPHKKGEFTDARIKFGDLAEDQGLFSNLTYDTLAGMGTIMTGAATGLSFTTRHMWNDEWGKSFGNWYDNVFGPDMNAHGRSATSEYKDRLKDTIGASDSELIMQMGLIPIHMQFKKLPEIDPDEFNILMSMAGGNEELAEAMLQDMIINDPDRQQEYIDAAQEVRRQAEYQIQDMEDEAFGIGDVLLDLIAVWGEGVENIATTVMTGGQWVIEGKSLRDNGIGQFWQEVRDNDTPAGVLGLEGTLVGLGIDLIASVALDPLTYIFGPRLSSAGRMGASTIDDVARMAVHPASNRLLLEISEVGLGHSTNAIAYQTILDNLAITGSDELMMAAGRGFAKPITSSRPYLKVYGKVADDVHYTVVGQFIDQDALARSAIEQARVSLERTGMARPTEITVNPNTGAAGITYGAEQAVALQLRGIDAIPTTIKVDLEFGGQAFKQINNMTPDQSAFVSQIADGTVAAELGAANKIKAGADTTAFDGLNSVIDTLDSRLGSQQVGTIPGKTENFTLFKMNGTDEGSIYFIRNANGEFKGGVFDNGTTLDMAISREVGRGGMAMIWDEARALGDDFILMHGKSASVSEQAIKFNQRYAQKLLDESTDALHIVDEGIEVVEWAKGIKADDVLDVNGATYMRPRRAMGEDIFAGANGNLELMQALYREHLAMGGDPIQGIKTTMATSVGADIGNFFRAAKPGTIGSKISNYVTPINSNLRFEWTSITAKSSANQFGARLWGSVQDSIGFEPFAARVNDFFLRRGELRLKGDQLTLRLKQLNDQADGALAFVGGGLDDWAKRFGTDLDDLTRANHRAVTDYVADIDRQIEEVIAAQKAMTPELNNFVELNSIMDDMMTDFKAQHINTNKAWDPYKVDGDVPWEVISGSGTDPAIAIQRVAERAKREGIDFAEAAQKELGYIPAGVAKFLKVADNVEINRFMTEAIHSLNTPTAWIAPASPLEIMAAASGGPVAVKGVIKATAGATAAEGIHTAHTLWMLDKVMTPRTAAVVSLDELMRIWHVGGTRSTFQYLEDKALGLTARVTRAKTKGGSWDKLPKRWQDRLTALEEYPVFYRQLERSFMETGGIGHSDIVFNKGLRGGSNVEYYTAARRTAGQLNNDAGFQAYLQGKDAFRDWFETSPKAQRLRDADFFDAALNSRRGGADWTEVWAGYDTVFEQWALSGIKKGKVGQARQIWKDAAAKQANLGSVAAGVAEMPEWVLEGFTRITGNTGAGGWKAGVNKLSKPLFQDPVDYRRGFLAEWVRKSENARLKKLYESQGIRVITDDELLLTIKRNYPGVPDDIIQPYLHSLSKDLYERSKVVTQRYVSELVETKVISEMENMLYSFNMSSQLGRSSKAFIPFGKPWADMWGFWGRELVSRPNLRGYINNTNFANISKVANRAVDALPFNPRTAGFMSRLAATDFELDNIGDDPLVGGLARSIGLSSVDVGPAMFLPKGGDNPFMVMIPGMGLIPHAALVSLFRITAPDPLDDPVGYQAHLDSWGTFIPGLHRNRPTTIKEYAAEGLVGGGLINKLTQGGENAQMMMPGEIEAGQSVFGQDWSARIAADRQIQVIFQDPDIWADLAELPPEFVDLGISAWLDEKLMQMTADATQASGFQSFKESLFEIGLPVQAQFDTQRDDLEDVWLEAIEWMGLELPNYLNMATPSGKEETAGWVRGRYFDLPDWERNALITEHEGLAVNLVSMWEWSPKAKALGITGGLPYRGGGSNFDIERQTTLRQTGMLDPITSRAFSERIIGTVLSAKVQNSRDLYVAAAHEVNGQRWEFVVSEEWREWFDTTATLAFANGDLPFETGRELWENYSKLQDLYDEKFDPDLYEPIGLPGKMRAWGEAMPSGPDSLREDFAEDEDGVGYPIPRITEEMQRQADAMGLDLFPEMEMADIYGAVANSISETYIDNPIFAFIGPSYKAWQSPRSASHQAMVETMGRILDGDVFMQETVDTYRKVQVWLEETLERRAMGDNSWLTMRREGVEMWGRMAQDDAWGSHDLALMWNQGYGKQLGPFDWVADEPAPLRLGPEEFNPDASPAFVRRVVDGDTIDVVFQTGDVLSRLGGYETFRVRLLGYNMAELDTDEGRAARAELNTRVQDAVEAGIPISIVRDPRYGNTDMFGRIFAWLYIGEDAVYDPESMIPGR